GNRGGIIAAGTLSRKTEMNVERHGAMQKWLVTLARRNCSAVRIAFPAPFYYHSRPESVGNSSFGVSLWPVELYLRLASSVCSLRMLRLRQMRCRRRIRARPLGARRWMGLRRPLPLFLVRSMCHRCRIDRNQLERRPGVSRHIAPALG